MAELAKDNTAWARVVANVAALALMLSGATASASSNMTDASTMPVAYSQPVIATSSAATYNQSQDWDLQFLKLENARAARLLKVVGQLDSKTALDYLARLRALFDGLPTGNLEIGHCAAIARTFLDARVALETAVPTVREWAVVARAVDPTLVDKPLRVPSRFVRRAQETEEAPLVFSASAAAVARAIRMTLEPADADSRPA